MIKSIKYCTCGFYKNTQLVNSLLYKKVLFSNGKMNVENTFQASSGLEKIEENENKCCVNDPDLSHN